MRLVENMCARLRVHGAVFPATRVISQFGNGA
jgi:hypothetical protein